MRCKNVTIQEMLKHSYDNYGDLDENDLEANEKILTRESGIMEPFSVFVKIIEDWMDVVEAVWAPCTDAQINNKVFSVILKACVFHDGLRE